MALKEIQQQVDGWVKQSNIGYFKPLEILARLVEENGELARELNHRFGPKKKKSGEETREVADEIGDIIFTLTCLANSLHINLDDAFNRTMKKYNSRDKDRWGKSETASD